MGQGLLRVKSVDVFEWREVEILRRLEEGDRWVRDGWKLPRQGRTGAAYFGNVVSRYWIIPDTRVRLGPDVNVAQRDPS